jgi:hypothetical protein
MAGQSTNDWRHYTVSDTNEIRRLIPFTKVKTKQPCGCDHIYEAQIQGPPGDIRVSFCDHCFEIVGGQFAGDYHMPSGFYDEFQRLAHEKAP